MSKYIISWDAGYGESHDIVEADSYAEAQRIAFEAWEDEAQSNAEYSVEDYDEELADDLGLL